MKKVFLLAIMACSFTIAYCQQANSLSSDPVFIETIKKLNEISAQIYNANKSSVKSISGIEVKVKNINNKLSELDYVKEFKIATNISNDYDLLSNFRLINNNIAELRSRNGANFTEKAIKEATSDTYKLMPDNLGIVSFDGGSVGGPCKNLKAYTACTVVAATTASGAVIACAAAGPAYFVCIALAAVGQTAAIYLCSVSYCE
jgi:hypothetical protein